MSKELSTPLWCNRLSNPSSKRSQWFEFRSLASKSIQTSLGRNTRTPWLYTSICLNKLSSKFEILYYFLMIEANSKCYRSEEVNSRIRPFHLPRLAPSTPILMRPSILYLFIATSSASSTRGTLRRRRRWTPRCRMALYIEVFHRIKQGQARAYTLYHVLE